MRKSFRAIRAAQSCESALTMGEVSCGEYIQVCRLASRAFQAQKNNSIYVAWCLKEIPIIIEKQNLLRLFCSFRQIQVRSLFTNTYGILFCEY